MFHRRIYNTWFTKIYAGRDISRIRQVGITENVYTELTDKLLNEGRTLFVDNFYTSYELALKFLNFKTHVVGTVQGVKKVNVANMLDRVYTLDLGVAKCRP